MKLIPVTMVRIYLTEKDQVLETLIDYLKNQAKVRGLTVYRAIEGYGQSGLHTSSLLSLSLNLPLTIEFFDEPDQIEPVLAYLADQIKIKHIVAWPAQTNAS